MPLTRGIFRLLTLLLFSDHGLKNGIAVSIFTILILGCTGNSERGSNSVESIEAIETDSVSKKLNETNPADSVVLHEAHIKGVSLPFPRREMLNELRNAF